MHRFIWKLISTDSQQLYHLQQALNIHPSLCALLIQRGIFTFEEAKNYFRPHLTRKLHSSYLFKDMEKAVQRILEAIQKNERILIYGDYDVDGTTSIAILYQFLINDLKIKNTINTYIPDRNLEGYGISDKGINFIMEQDTNLLITVDCGSSEDEKIAFLKHQNIETIICDHHTVSKKIPNAVAVINPKQQDCSYPFKELCGCGITLKLILALAEKLNLNVDAIFQKYIDFVALATVADIVELKDENRIFVIEGLKKINQHPAIPIQAIQEVQKLKSPIDTYHIGFVFAPLINAAGRMNHAQMALQLLLCNDIVQAKLLAKELQSLNEERKLLDELLLQEALQNMNLKEDSFSIVVYEPHWHKGVLGIAASKLVDRFYKPTIVLTLQNDVWTGSGRSIEGVDLHEIIYQCRDYLSHFGGHYFAAGLSIKKENLQPFIIQFEALVKESLSHQKPLPSIHIQQELSFNHITENFYNIIQQMQPFGKGNEEPLFCTRGVKLIAQQVLKEIHSSYEWQHHQKTFKSILFQHATHYFPYLEIGNKYDIVYKLVMNEWQQKRELRLQIIDIAESMIPVN